MLNLEIVCNTLNRIFGVVPASPKEKKKKERKKHNILEPVRTPSLWKEMICGIRRMRERRVEKKGG
jgi:hypothetical protein